jgi:hypothetical protein
MHLWSTLYSSSDSDNHAVSLPSDVTAAMLSAACGAEHGGGALQLKLSKLFKQHAASQSLFAIMT